MSLFDFIPEKILKGQKLLTIIKKSLFPAVINDRNARIFGRFKNIRRRTFFKLFISGCDASATLEATISFPVLLMFFLALFWMLELFWIHTAVESELYSIGNEIVACSYSFSELFSSEGIDSDLLSEIGKIGFNEAVIAGKIKKVLPAKRTKYLNTLLSDTSRNNTIDIKVTYMVTPIMEIPGIKGVWLTNHFYSKAFVGDTSLVSKDTGDIVVYITKNGSVYHTSLSCWTIKTRISQVTLRDVNNIRSKDGSKYYACTKCGKQEGNSLVYVTPYGNRYHCNLNCSELKTDIYAVKLSEVKDRRKCKSCP